MLNMHHTITKLHAAYCAMTGLQVRQANWEHEWWAFHQAGYGEEDLRDVLQWLLKENRKNSYQWSLRLSAILNLQVFDEHLAQARLRRPKAKTEAQKVVDQFRQFRAEEETNKVVPIKDALKRAVSGL